MTTIVLTSDPVEMSRWDIRAEMNVQLYQQHVVRVEQDWRAGSVQLTVEP